MEHISMARANDPVRKLTAHGDVESNKKDEFSSLRVPSHLKDSVKVAAAAKRISMSDYVATVLNTAVRRDLPNIDKLLKQKSSPK